MSPGPRDTQKLPTASFPPAADGTNEERSTERALSIPTTAVCDRVSVTIMNGADAGRVFAFDRNELSIGRDDDVDIRIDDPSVSRRHARLMRRGGGIVLEDLGSTNGTFLGGHQIQRADLSNGDRIQIGPNFTLRFAVTDEAEELLQRQLYEGSTRDPLTGAFNRKYLWERLAAEIAHSRRHKSSLGVLLFDIDEFKRTNDVYGHLAGDAVLRAIANRVSLLTRIEDVFARYGGEEFVILVRAAGTHDPAALAERVRAAIQGMVTVLPEATLKVTVSLGVVTLGELPDDASGRDLIAKADERLYRAKAAGRNRVVASD